MNPLQLNYEKRKNTILFDKCKKSDIFHFDEIQNYIPIYKNFFELNENNFNSINLNHSKYFYDINISNNELDFFIKHNDDIIKKPIFIKFAPILDPFKYMIGKYDELTDFSLPNITQVENNHIYNKINDINNSAYVDGLFSFISSKLLNEYNFLHGIDFFGSFVGIKNNFKINIEDDIDYLIKYEFFNKNKKIFGIEDDLEVSKILPPINIKNLTILNNELVNKNNNLLNNNLINNNLPNKNLVDKNMNIFSNLNNNNNSNSSNNNSNNSHTDEINKLKNNYDHRISIFENVIEKHKKRSNMLLDNVEKHLDINRELKQQIEKYKNDLENKDNYITLLIGEIDDFKGNLGYEKDNNW